jgi:hypothetical protein
LRPVAIFSPVYYTKDVAYINFKKFKLMSRFEELGESFTQSMDNLWTSIVDYAPTFLSAILVLILGVVISILLGKFAGRIINLIRVDKLTEKVGVQREVKKFGISLNFAVLTEWIVKWFFFIVTFVVVVDILNIEQLTSFLEKLVLYLPNVIVAIIILAVGLVIGKVLKDAVENSLRAFAFTQKVASFLGSLAKTSIFVFALMAAFVQLGVAADLIQILFTGFVAMLAIAGGLAFGLGGKDHASKVLNWVETEVKPRK